MPKKGGAHKEAKGLESDESLDAALNGFASKQCDKILNKTKAPDLELEIERQRRRPVNTDCAKPSLAWDPLALSGPHAAIGAGAAARGVGEVALD